MAQMVIANRLTDGRVVFLASGAADGGPGHHWVDDIGQGASAIGKAAAEQLLALARDSEAANEVVDPALIEVTEGNGPRRPLAWREVIRAAGPTVRTDLP